MRRVTQKYIREFVRNGQAIDITKAIGREAIPEPYEQVAFSSGGYGVNGAIFQGCRTGAYYAITARSSSLFIFL